MSSDDDRDEKNLTAPPPMLKVMDAFDVIRSFIAAHDNDITMQLLTDCENSATALAQSKKKN